MRLLIIGAGAVGCFLGAKLGLAGHRVTLVGREHLSEAVARHGLVLVDSMGSRTVPGIAAVTDLSMAPAGSPENFDLALLTVKAYDTATVAQEIAACPWMNDVRVPILTFQNGVGNEELLANLLGGDRVLSAAIDTPVSMPSPGIVQVHRERYEIGLAAVQAETVLERVCQMLRGAGFSVHVFDDHRSMKWTKLLMNMLANASSAILDWNPAQLMADPIAARLEAEAWQEALAVMAAHRIRPVNLAGYPFPLIASLARRLPAAWLSRLLRLFVSGGRGDKLPSLNLALAGGRRSEVAWLNGAVVEYGRALSIETPVNAVLTDELMRLSLGTDRRERFKGRPDLLGNLVEEERKRT